MINKVKVLIIISILTPFCAALGGSFGGDQSYSSGVYIGIEGAYVYANDTAKYSNVTYIMPSELETTNRHNTFHGAAFLGYGHFFPHGNLPYLGLESGFSWRGKYDGGPTVVIPSIDSRAVKINAQKSIYLDLIPGFFFDRNNTTLLYGRAGVEGDIFRMSTATFMAKQKRIILFRVGAGVEHEIVNNFFLRFQYVLSLPTKTITFRSYNALDAGRYSTRALLHTFALGISYRWMW